MKKIYIINVIVFIIMFVGCSSKYNLSDDIIAEIDKNYNEAGSCEIALNKITDFQWDKCVIFDYGSNNSEISASLGVDYNGIVDGHSGIVFAYDNEIVYEETKPYNPDHPKNFDYCVEKTLGGPTFISFSYDDAILEGTRRKVDDRYYFTLTAIIK